MKKLIFTLSALFFAFSTQAATLGDNYVASDGKVFQISNILSVEKGINTVMIKQLTGTVQPFADATGSVWNKVVNSYGFSQRFIRVGTSDRYMETTHTTEISCINNQSAFGYTSAQPEYFADGCALQNAVKANSN